MQHLEAAVSAFTALEYTDCTDPELTYHKVVAGIHSLCVAIREAEMRGMDRSTIRAAVEPARTLHAKSPFCSRIQSWPRGYPGDFETIEYICDCTPHVPLETVGHYIEYHTLRDISAQQHRNKVAWQARQILEVAHSRSQARILSIACGGSRDLRSIESILATGNASLFLNDMDADALSHSIRELPLLAGNIHTIHGDVFRGIRRFSALAPLDLIVAGGLFDYVTDRQFSWVLPRLVSLLAPDGIICFTNLADGHPDRVWLQYIADWPILERKTQDIERLVMESGLAGNVSVSISRDTTGLTHLVKLQSCAGDPPEPLLPSTEFEQLAIVHSCA